MRKFATCFIAFLVCAPAVVGAAVSRVVPTADAIKTDTVEKTGRTTVSRNVARNVSEVSQNAGGENVARSTVSRTVATSNDSNLSDANVSRSSVGRSAKSVSSDGRSKLDAAVHTVGRNARVSAASINNNPALRRAGVVLRPSTAEVGGRATIGGTDIQTGSNIDEQVRGVKARAVTSEGIAEAQQRLEQLSELNKSCQQQYNDCMDQFCAVVDANQGRCSCSSNLAKYTKSADAVKAANTELNTVAQRIRYVGLSADEIRAILTETEAEEVLSGQRDTSETRNMLAEIESMIKDPTVTSSSYSETASIGLDMDLDFSSDSSDIFSLDFLNSGNSDSFSNLRGRDLYNVARKRCGTILNQCKEAGATSTQITGNYDVAIDKDCIAYENGLKKMNDTLVSNVRSAELMLQKARLAVLQNKNQYDAKGCIAALDTCMRDDMVCGDDYYKCIDPTKRYIDENGEVVMGQNISLITEFMEGYNNANIDKTFLEDAQKIALTPENCKVSGTSEYGDGSCVVKYLLSKIGTGAKQTDGGLCRAVLDKCQRYTYSSEGVYNPYNDVVINYIQRALTNIRSAQRNIISDYASNCMIDVAKCYNNQVAQVNSWTSSAGVSNVYNIMRGACRNVALTCGMAIFSGPPELQEDGNNGCDAVSGCTDEACENDAYVTCVSEIFYESLLCPANSGYDATCSNNTTGCINARCKCLDGYEIYNGACVTACGEGYQRNNSTGQCEATSGSGTNAQSL